MEIVSIMPFESNDRQFIIEYAQLHPIGKDSSLSLGIIYMTTGFGVA
jgi:hypothetical protein